MALPVAVGLALPGLRVLASAVESKAAVGHTAPSYLHQPTRTFYWAKPVVKYRFTRPEQATDLNRMYLPATELSDAQKDATRDGLAKWQAALASNAEEAQRRFVEVGPDEAAEIEFIVMPKSFFPPNVFGLTSHGSKSNHLERPCPNQAGYVTIFCRPAYTKKHDC